MNNELLTACPPTPMIGLIKAARRLREEGLPKREARRVARRRCNPMNRRNSGGWRKRSFGRGKR